MVTTTTGGRETLPASDLVGVQEIADRAGVAVATVHSWRRRHPDFPMPLVMLASGPVWSWASVSAWIAVPRGRGRPRSRG